MSVSSVTEIGVLQTAVDAEEPPDGSPHSREVHIPVDT